MSEATQLLGIISERQGMIIGKLESIDASLKALVTHFGAGQQPPQQQTQSSGRAYTGPAIPTARELDSKHGDPKVRTKDPRDWAGDSMRDSNFSECSPEYLELYAPFLDWMADREQANDTPNNDTIYYKRHDAAMARGWAARKRAGWQPPAQDESTGFPSDDAPPVPDDSIPF